MVVKSIAVPLCSRSAQIVAVARHWIGELDHLYSTILSRPVVDLASLIAEVSPGHLDRNFALVGRVVEGIENLSARPRGTEALGFYKTGTVARLIRTVRLASAMPATERPGFQVMKTGNASFGAYVRARANRQDQFFNVPAGGVDLCNAPVPVRRTPAPSSSR